MMAYLDTLNHPDTYTAVVCERAFLTALDGSCRTPIAGHALRGPEGNLVFSGLIAHPDGIEVHKISDLTTSFDNESAVLLGEEAGKMLKEKAGTGLMDYLNQEVEGFNPNQAPNVK